MLDIYTESLPIGVIFISQVFETSSDLVFANWNQSILNGGVLNLVDGDLGRFDGILCDSVFALLIVEDEEILQGLLSV